MNFLDNPMFLDWKRESSLSLNRNRGKKRWRQKTDQERVMVYMSFCMSLLYSLDSFPSIWSKLYPPEFIWSPSPQYLRTWPYLEIGSLHMWLGKRRSYWSREGPNPIWQVSYKKGKFGNRKHAGRASSTDRGRDQGDVFTKMSSKPPEARWEAWVRFSLRTLRKNQHCQHLDLEGEVLASRTVRQYISIKCLWFVALCSSSHSKQIHHLSIKFSNLSSWQHQ